MGFFRTLDCFKNEAWRKIVTSMKKIEQDNQVDFFGKCPNNLPGNYGGVDEWNIFVKEHAGDTDPSVTYTMFGKCRNGVELPTDNRALVRKCTRQDPLDPRLKYDELAIVITDSKQVRVMYAYAYNLTYFIARPSKARDFFSGFKHFDNDQHTMDSASIRGIITDIFSRTPSMTHYRNNVGIVQSVPAMTQGYITRCNKGAVGPTSNPKPNSHGHDDRVHDDRVHDDRVHDDRVYDDRVHDDRVHDDRVHDDRVHDDRVHDDRVYDDTALLECVNKYNRYTAEADAARARANDYRIRGLGAFVESGISNLDPATKHAGDLIKTAIQKTQTGQQPHYYNQEQSYAPVPVPPPQKSSHQSNDQMLMQTPYYPPPPQGPPPQSGHSTRQNKQQNKQTKQGPQGPPTSVTIPDKPKSAKSAKSAKKSKGKGKKDNSASATAKPSSNFSVAGGPPAPQGWGGNAPAPAAAPWVNPNKGRVQIQPGQQNPQQHALNNKPFAAQGGRRPHGAWGSQLTVSAEIT